MMRNVKIDQEGCIACGSCYALCPKVFEDDGTGTAQIVEEFRVVDPGKGEVGDEIACVENAEDSCPVNVITVS
ncbi:MAG: ferredoxin [Candidatus Thermoplasmatota archaeon]